MIIDNKDIIIFSLFSVIIVLILMTNTKDHFALTGDEKKLLDSQATSDINTIRTITNFIKKIITNDTFTMPNIKVNDLYLNKNMILKGSSVIDNEIDFITHNNNIILDVFPRYSIIIYHNENLPNRWVLCDGTTWWIHETDISISPTNIRPPYNVIANYNEIDTPDLRGRFICGSDNANFAEEGGKEKVTLTEQQLPPHAHPTWMVYNSNASIGLCKYINNKCHDKSPYKSFSEINVIKKEQQRYALDTSLNGTFAYTEDLIDEKGNKSVYEGALPHNNMPPYITSYYIMKL